MTAREQHDHSHLKLYVTLGNMDNAKLQWYQDQHAERYWKRHEHMVQKLRRARERWQRWQNRFQR